MTMLRNHLTGGAVAAGKATSAAHGQIAIRVYIEGENAVVEGQGASNGHRVSDSRRVPLHMLEVAMANPLVRAVRDVQMGLLDAMRARSRHEGK